jgi:hypothetical protein
VIAKVIGKLLAVDGILVYAELKRYLEVNLINEKYK